MRMDFANQNAKIKEKNGNSIKKSSETQAKILISCPRESMGKFYHLLSLKVFAITMPSLSNRLISY